MTAEVEGGITNQRLQEMLTLHRVDITRLLRGLVKHGLLVSDGQGRGTRYFPVDEVGGKESGPRFGAPSISTGSPPILADSPSISTGSPSISGGSPPILPGEASDVAASTDPTDDPILIAQAVPVSGSGAAPRALIRETILRLCAGRHLGLRELSQLLQRKPETVRGYVTALVKDGLLDLRYPETPSHRDQAYRTRADHVPGGAA